MEILTADQIRAITEQNIRSTYKNKLEKIFNECIERAKDNSYQVELFGIDIDDTLKKYLEILGYTLEKSENRITYTISW